MDIDKEIEAYRKEKEMRRQAFLQKALEKMDGELAYQSLLLFICKRFNLDGIHWTPSVAYILTNYFIENVDEPFDEWVHKNDAPFVRKLSDARKIFHEFDFMETNAEIITLANRFYNLDIKIEAQYMYSFSLDFNSFTPLELDNVRELKNEICVLEKYNVDCTELYEKLDNYGLSEDELELI